MATCLPGCLLLATNNSKCRIFCEHPSQVFETDLARSLEKLHFPSSSDLLSLRRLCAAMDVVITTQEAVKEALCKHPLKGAIEILQVQKFFEDSVKLLDVCSMLEDGLLHIIAYTKSAQAALKHVCAGSMHLIRAKKALISTRMVCAEYGLDRAATSPARVKRHRTKQLVTSSSMLQRMGDKLTAPEICSVDIDNLNNLIPSTALSATVYGAEMVTLFFVRFLVTVLSSASKPCQVLTFSPLQISAKRVWVHPLLLLQSRLRKVIPRVSGTKRAYQRSKMSVITCMPELQIIDDSLNKISDLLVQCLDQPTSQALRDTVRHHGEATLKRVEELQDSVTKLQKQLKIVSRSLVDVRMVLA